MPDHSNILERHDAGESIEAIAAAEGVSTRHVYHVLAKHRPDRPRKPRTCTSAMPGVIRGLHDQGMAAARIASVLGISRAYVYRHIAS